MKKSIVIVIGLLLIIAALPIIGNSFMKSHIDERVAELNSFGLVALVDEEESTYLHSSRHFEFLLKDSQKFLKHLQQYSAEQTPVYVDALLGGMLVGADIKYNNLPFEKALSIDIYPLALSKKMQETLVSEDEKFAQYVAEFFQKKGFLYHIDYNVINRKFKGYIQDIDERYTLQSGIDFHLGLSDANFKGQGLLLAPDELDSNIKLFRAELVNGPLATSLSLDSLSVQNNFESNSTYVSSAKMDKMEFTMQSTRGDMNISIEAMRLNGSSNTQGENVELYSKTSFKEMHINSLESEYLLEGFTLDFAFSELDKKSFEELCVLLAQESDKSGSFNDQALYNAFVALVAKGLRFEIADLSLKQLTGKKEGKFGAFEIHSLVDVKEDAGLSQKLILSPLFALSNLSMETKIELAEKIYATLLDAYPLLQVLERYKKEDAGKYLFDIKMQDSKISVNDKAVL